MCLSKIDTFRLMLISFILYTHAHTRTGTHKQARTIIYLFVVGFFFNLEGPYMCIEQVVPFNSQKVGAE